MAVFTAIASAIVGAIGISTATIIGSLTWAGLATSIIAGGLAMATAKVLGVFKPPSFGNQKDPGVKIQLPPATDNKLPVFYGRNITGGIIVDAGITNQNNTMIYVICISEKTDSGSYTVQKIYRDDATLNFGTFASSHIVQSVTDPNATSTTAVSGKMRCRVYAGNAQSSSNQIFPTTGTPVAAQTLLSTISANTSYDDLVYAVFELDYDPENGLTGLGAINFDITNSLSEPSNVMLDYMQNSRYGAGLSASDLDTDSFDDLYDYSTTQVPYTTSVGTGDVQDRWRVDGMLSTYGNVKDNIDLLCQTSSTFFTYNPKKGKFAVVPNRAATTAEKNAAFELNDDNMTGAISITSTDLYGLYNEVEVEYPSLIKKDQTDTVFVTTPAGDRNANEPDNKLSTRYPLVNDNTRVENLANIDLRQSRTSTVLEVVADYSAIQIDAGDVVKVTNTEYDFTDKLFRAMRVTEKEDEGGMLSAQIVLLEYSDDVYTHSNVQSRGEPGASGIPGWWTNWTNANIDYGNITIITDGDDANANIVDSGNGNVIANIDYANITFPTLPGDIISGPFAAFDLNLPANVFYNELDLDINPVGTDFAAVTPTTYTFTPPAGNSYFAPNTTVSVGIPLTGFSQNELLTPNIDTFTATISGRDDLTGVKSQANTTANITVTPKNFIPKESVADFTSGVQLEDTPPNNTSVASGTTFQDIITPATYDFTGADIGDYSFTAEANLGGTITGVFDVGFTGNVEMEFANTTHTTNVKIQQGGVELINANDFTPQLNAGGKFSNDPVANGLPADMRAQTIEISLQGYTDVDTSNTAPRGFGNMKYEVLHVTKGEK